MGTLASGERLRIAAPPGCLDYRAALSPDGRAIATLTQDEDWGFIVIVDPTSQSRRRLWTGACGPATVERR